MKFLCSLILVFLCGCQSGNVSLTDKYEDKAYLHVPNHVEVIKVNGRMVSSGMSLTGKLTFEIPVGRTEVVFQFFKIYSTRHNDDHEKVLSDKNTVIFIAEKSNHYELSMPEPYSYDEAMKMRNQMKGSLLHRESGTKIEAVLGVVEERFHGIKIMKPYDELKHWWKKATQKEKDDFLKWIQEQ